MDNFVVHEGSNSDEEEEDELEKYIDPVSGYPYYVNVRTGHTFWAYEGDDNIKYSEFTHAEDVVDNSPVETQIQLDEDHNEWGIDSPTTRNNYEQVQCELNEGTEEEEYTGFVGDIASHEEPPPSNHFDVTRGVTRIVYENNVVDEIIKQVEAPFDDRKTGDAIQFNDADEFTQFSQNDGERMVTTSEAEDSNGISENDNKRVCDYNLNSNCTESCELNETSCDYYDEKDGICNERPSREGISSNSIYESLSEIRIDEIPNEITKRDEIEHKIKENLCGGRNSSNEMGKRAMIGAETESLTSCSDSSLSQSPPRLLTVAKATSGGAQKLRQEEEEEEADHQQEVDDKEREEDEANENKITINRDDEIQMFASLKAAQFVGHVMNIGKKRARLYILEENSRCIAKMLRSQKQIRSQFYQNRQNKKPQRNTAATYFTDESDCDNEGKEDEAITNPPQPLCLEQHQSEICEFNRIITENKDLATSQRMRTLNLNSTDVLDMPALTSVMKGNSSSIISLSLVNSSLGDEAAKLLSNALPNLTSLRKLYLGNNEILCPGARSISIAVSTLPALEVLSLSHNPIGPKGIRSLATLIAQSTCQLKTLKIGGCISPPARTRWKTIPDVISQDIRYPGDEGAICLAAALLAPHACPLKSLSYINAGFSGIGTRAFAAALFCTPPSLTNLNLLGSIFAEKDPTAADVLEAAVSVASHRLKQITLTSCGLTRDTAERIYSLVDNPATRFPSPPSWTWIEERELGDQATALRSWLLDAASKLSFSYPREEQRFPTKQEGERRCTRDASLQNRTCVAQNDNVRPLLENSVTEFQDKVSARDSRIIIEEEANDSRDKMKREEKALSDYQRILISTLKSFSSLEMQELLEASCFAPLREKVKALCGRKKWEEICQCCSIDAPERTVVVAETSVSTNTIVEKFRTIVKIDQVIARLEKPMNDVEFQSEIVKQRALDYNKVMSTIESQNIIESSRITLLELARPLDSAISLGGLIAALHQDPNSTVDELNMTIKQRKQLYHDRKKAMDEEEQQKRLCESRRLKKQTLENKRKKRERNKLKRKAERQINT